MEQVQRRAHAEPFQLRRGEGVNQRSVSVVPSAC